VGGTGQQEVSASAKGPRAEWNFGTLWGIEVRACH
jgi:hypothetical protein